MDENLKEAMRLLIECADEMRVCEEEHHHTVSRLLKKKLRAIFAKHGLTDPATVANLLCIPQGERG